MFVTIPKRFCGPPDSGNGGYVCGTTAAALGTGDFEVSLLAPPPLERQLRLELNDDTANLTDGETTIAVARRSESALEFPTDAPPQVSYATATEAADNFDVDAYRAGHEYPTCFTCGPDRDAGDGLRIFPAPTDRVGHHVWPWTPDRSHFDQLDHLTIPLIWAALDCQSGLAWMSQEPGMAAVLGRMAASIVRSPRPNERVIVAGWTEKPEGRRRPARSAIYTESGDVLAASRATWVVLTDEQRHAFRSSR